MLNIERRTHIRKQIRMPCTLVFSNGLTIYGYTSNVGLEGIAVESSMNMSKMDKSISLSDSGLLMISYTKNKSEEKIRLRCQVRHISGNGFGLSIRFYELNANEQEILGRVIAKGSNII